MQARFALVLAAAAAVAAPAFAQPDAQCILAGRLSDGQWAPRFQRVQLLTADGRVESRADKQALAAVRRARLAAPALLARCDGGGPLFNADGEPPGSRTEVPAVSAGVIEVEAVAYPKLRTGGELVELRVRVPAERVVMVR